MASKEDLEFIISVVDKASAQTKKINDEMTRLIETQNKASRSASEASMSFGKLTAAFTAGGLITTGVQKIMGFFNSELQTSIKEAQNLQSVMLGLNSTAAAYGQNQDQARAAAGRLKEDGMIGLTTAAGGLQKLMQAGLGLDQATQLMNAYKDQAAFGKVATLSMDQAVGNLAESFMTENAQIGNLSGQTENYSLIVSRGAAIMGKQESQLTQAERVQAKYLGTMQLAEVVAGDSERASTTLTGAQARLDQTVQQLHQNIGNALTPALYVMIDGLNGAAQGTDSVLGSALQNSSKTLAEWVGNIQLGIQALFSLRFIAADFFNTMKEFGSKIMQGDIMGAFSVKGDFQGAFAKAATEYQKAAINISKSVSNGIKAARVDNVVKGQVDKIPEVVKNASDKTQKELERLNQRLQDNFDDMAKTVEDFNHSVELKTADFQRSLTDLVIKHREAIAQLRKDLAELSSEFNANNQDRVDSHQERADEINAKYAEETANLQGNLARRLADEHSSDQQLIAYFQALIAEKDKKRAEDLAKEDAKFAKEQEKALEAYNKSRAALEEKLNAELAIQHAHQAEFDAVKDKAAEDDITRLQSSFEREMTELKRQHNDRMEELKKEQLEILALKAATEAKMASGVASSAQSRGVNVSSSTAGNAFVSQSRQPVYGPPNPKTGKIDGMVVNQTNNIYNSTDVGLAMQTAAWRLGLS